MCFGCYRLLAKPDGERPPRDVAIDRLRTDGGIVTRDGLRQSVVEDYADAVRAGATFPPADAFDDGESLWLADGFHRREAYSRAGAVSMPVRVHPGTRQDAVIFAARQNQEHGIRRSDKDKRAAVRMLLREFPDRSTEWLAVAAGVHWCVVDKLRSAEGRPELVQSRDGITRRSTISPRTATAGGAARGLLDGTDDRDTYCAGSVETKKPGRPRGRPGQGDMGDGRRDTAAQL